MKTGLNALKPYLGEGVTLERKGVIIIGTVKGDLHDIGKNLVSMMAEGAGYEVHDLGVDISSEKFMEAVREHDADIVGMSALLTTTMPYMGVVIEELDKRGILKELPVMVGGAPLNQEFADAINAHTYGRDAAMSAELAKAIVGKNR
jgi:methylmalonyl-CoA mutase cobalamin-binding domain/chain